MKRLIRFLHRVIPPLHGPVPCRFILPVRPREVKPSVIALVALSEACLHRKTRSFVCIMTTTPDRSYVRVGMVRAFPALHPVEEAHLTVPFPNCVRVPVRSDSEAAASERWAASPGPLTAPPDGRLPRLGLSRSPGDFPRSESEMCGVVVFAPQAVAAERSCF